MKTKKKNTKTKSEKISKLTKEDGQSEELEEKRIKVKKGFKLLFSKDMIYCFLDKKYVEKYLEKTLNTKLSTRKKFYFRWRNKLLSRGSQVRILSGVLLFPLRNSLHIVNFTAT